MGMSLAWSILKTSRWNISSFAIITILKNLTSNTIQRNKCGLAFWQNPFKVLFFLQCKHFSWTAQSNILRILLLFHLLFQHQLQLLSQKILCFNYQTIVESNFCSDKAMNPIDCAFFAGVCWDAVPGYLLLAGDMYLSILLLWRRKSLGRMFCFQHKP